MPVRDWRKLADRQLTVGKGFAPRVRLMGDRTHIEARVKAGGLSLGRRSGNKFDVRAELTARFGQLGEQTLRIRGKVPMSDLRIAGNALPPRATAEQATAAARRLVDLAGFRVPPEKDGRDYWFMVRR
jgi:hypothetical protein